MTEVELMVDLHLNSERQGPGSKRETLKALEFIDLSTQATWKVADIGCGSGGQTITLAEEIEGKIIAVDLFPEFLGELKTKSEKMGFGKKIATIQASMEDLPFEKGEFDVIWSEGAIYNVGFEQGIEIWKDYLKDGGYLAVSEMTWITNYRPREIEEYWNKEYPEIDTASNKIQILEDNGYTLEGYFYLEKESWIKKYYLPLQTRFSSFLQRHNFSKLAKEVVGAHEKEIELYQKFSDHYSYGFYIAKKNS